VILPAVTARVEKRRELSSILVNTRYVRTFISVASRAGQAEIVEPRLAMVLLGDDVINLEGQGISLLREPAVFAEPLGSIPHAPG
jgi:hypothetical protein